MTVRLGRRDFEHRIGGAKLGDAYRAVMERADDAPDGPDDFDAAMERLEESDPVPTEMAQNFRLIEEWDEDFESAETGEFDTAALLAFDAGRDD